MRHSQLTKGYIILQRLEQAIADKETLTVKKILPAISGKGNGFLPIGFSADGIEGREDGQCNKVGKGRKISNNSIEDC